MLSNASTSPPSDRFVVHLVSGWPQQGGVGDVVSALLACAEPRGRPARVLSDDGARLPGLVIWRRLEPILDRVSLAVLHGVFTPALATAAVLLRRHAPGIRIVAYPHDAYDSALFSSHRCRKELYFRLVERRLLDSADLVVVSAPRHVRDLRSRQVQTPAVVVPPGLDPPRVRATPRAAEPVRAVVLGRWDVWDKGIDLLASAFERAPGLRRRMAIRFVGPEQGARQVVAALLSRAQVPAELVGWAPDASAELAAADVLLSPSRKEGFGLAPFQALAVGLPVLLTDVAGLTDYVCERDGAIVVRPTPAGIASGLQRLLDERSVLTSAAQAFVRRLPEFTWHRLHDVIVGPSPAGDALTVDTLLTAPGGGGA